MTENNQPNQSNNSEINKDKTLLGTHVFCLVTDVWQLQATKIEAIKKLLPHNDKLDKIIQIARVLDKNQKEIDYYQARIRGIIEAITKLKHEKK